jgi:hypothetical protein
VCSALLWRCSTHLSNLITASHSWPLVFSVQLSILSLEMFGPVQWMELSRGWSPTLLPCCRAPSPALIATCFHYHVVCLFRVVQSMLIVVVCHLFPIRERNECKIDACVSNQKYKWACGLPCLCRLAFCSDCPTKSLISLRTIDASCDLLCAHFHLPERCLLQPFPPHIIPLNNFLTLEEK